MQKHCVCVKINPIFDVADVGRKIAQIPGKNEILNISSLLFHSVANPFDIVVNLKTSNDASISDTVRRQINNIPGVVYTTLVSMVDIPIE